MYDVSISPFDRSQKIFLPLNGPNLIPHLNACVANIPRPAPGILLCFISSPSGKLAYDLFASELPSILSANGVKA